MNTGNAISAPSALDDPRWAAVVARDPAADGQFVYAVRTTGIYCRPTCPSRRAKPQNVLFYTSANEAEEHGYRPCQRCQPNQTSPALRQQAMISGLCRLIEQSEQEPSLQALAEHAAMSSYHLHRLFKSITGLTPKAYAKAQRAQRLRNELGQGTTVTDAMYQAGYNSNGRFYAEADQVLGMTPTHYKTGGANNAIVFATGQCSLGQLLVARSKRGICAIALGDKDSLLIADLHRRFPQATQVQQDADFADTLTQVIALIDTPERGLNLPLDIQGTAFQQRVWQALQQIPVGATTSYSELAQRLDMPKATRAVASACAANTLAVVIPCHRVLRTTGELSGYRWGVARKRALLEREADIKTAHATSAESARS